MKLFTNALLLALLGISLSAQSVKTGEIHLLGTHATDLTAPADREPITISSPPELIGTDQIKYALVVGSVDEDGNTLTHGVAANDPIITKVVKDAYSEHSLLPASRAGLTYPSTYWRAFIFNPSGEDDTSIPKLLTIRSGIIDKKTYQQLSKTAQKQRRWTVPVTVTVNPDGSVGPIAIKNRQDEEFSAIIQETVRQWIFAPAKSNGQPTTANINLDVLLLYPEPFGGKFVKAKPITRVPPVYPPSMKANGMNGDVYLELTIDKKGDVSNVAILKSSSPAFEENAVQTMLKWKFQPATIDNVPCKSVARIQLTFNLFGGDAPAASISVDGEQSSLPAEYRYDTPPRPMSIAYPVLARAALRSKLSGKATVLILLDDKGEVINTKIINATSPELGLALAATLDSFRFTPAYRDGKPTATLLKREQAFSPNSKEDQTRDEDLSLLKKMDKNDSFIIAAGELDKKPKPTTLISPRFPTALLDSHETGDAVIQVIINESGRACLPEIVSSSAPEFGYAAMLAVTRWRFEPPLYKGKAAVTRINIPFKFKKAPPSDKKTEDAAG
jgi:TonB family protein